MTIFVSTTFADNQSSVLDVIESLTENNIHNIELGSIHRPEGDLDSRLKRKNCNFLTHNFFPPTTDRLVLNISSTDNEIRSRSLGFIKNAIDFSELIGATIYTIHPGFLVDPAGESLSAKNYDFDFSSATAASVGDYHSCYNIFLDSLCEIDDYVRNKSITVAIETQGSVSKKDLILFSRPQDFTVFFKKNLSEKIAINLNLGHLNLAASAWGFDRYEFVEMLKPGIAAVEVSHNNGVEDDHQALEPDSWYTDLLKDDFFRHIPVIFEGRNLAINEVVRSYTLLRKNLEH